MGKEQGVRSGGPRAAAGSKTDGTGYRSEKEGLTMNEIYELIDKITLIVKKEFPEATDTRIVFDVTGYVSLDVYIMKEDENLPVEAWKRRELLQQFRFADGHFSEDRSDTQNEYYRQRKVLLEE
jgi:hypothetical protein